MATFDPALEPPSRHTLPRWLIVVAGLWLVASAFALPHASDARIAAAIIGVLITVIGAWSLYEPQVRYAATALGLLEVVAVVVIPHQSVTEIWSDGWVAVFVFAVSLIPGSPAAWTGRRLNTRNA